MDWVTFVDKAAPWNALSGIGTTLTALFALLVYVEARRIRRADWLSVVLEKWQGFNRLLIETKNSDRWDKVRSGAIASDQLTAEDKRIFILFFNLQQIEFEASKSRLLPSTMGLAMGSQIAQMHRLAPYITALFEEVGYDPEFREFVKRKLADGDNKAM